MYKVAYAAVQGRSHVEKGIPCQDRVASLRENGITVLSLADGAGSAKYSDIGAEIVVNQVNRLLVENFHELYCMNERDVKMKVSLTIFYSLFWELSDKQGKFSLKDLSSTLLFIAVNCSNYLVGHIGDGTIGFMHNDGGEEIIDVLSYPEKGEYHNTTFFTTDHKLQQHLRIYRGSMENITGFIIMSDGGDESLFNRKENIFSASVWNLFDWLCKYSEEKVSLALFKNIEKKFRLKTPDDCSVGILIRAPDLGTTVRFVSCKT